MSKLFVLGDSYAALHEGHIDKSILPESTQWSYLLSQKLNMELINHGVGGSSVEYAVNRFYEKVLPIIQRDDILVFCKTFYLRKFLDKNKPTFSMPPVIESLYNSELLSAKDHAFYVRYFTDIVRSDVESYHSFNFINSLAYYVYKYNFKVVVMNCFPRTPEEEKFDYPKNIIVSKGCLSHVTRYEFTDSEISDKKIPADMMDPRRNHMSVKNHMILVDKIYNSIQNKAPLDLNTGFERNLYSVEELCKTAHNRTEWNKANLIK